ncbi:MAG: hypothetical protein HY268_12705 [Deltaproteobacteria bacterium]|nr:hypothetical protein [Deltaproteobacteria bacterium]
MGLWERLIGTGPVEEKDARSVLPELLASYGEEVRLARQIREHADQAPHQIGAQQLHAVAEEQDRLAQLLRDKITALGGEVSDHLAPLRGGKNHWARVARDLEETQALRRHYNEQAIRWDPHLPDVVELYRMLEQEKNRIIAALRDIALRADPHALD